MVCHFVSPTYRCVDYFNNVDADAVPVPHFGVVLSAEQFHALAARVEAAGVPFIVAPHLRFSGQPGEQWVRARWASRGARQGSRTERVHACVRSASISTQPHRTLAPAYPYLSTADNVLQGPGGKQPRIQGYVYAREFVCEVCGNGDEVEACLPDVQATAWPPAMRGQEMEMSLGSA
jgi:hypothetical protein